MKILNETLSLKAKLRIFSSNIKGVLFFYGAETWRVIKQIIDRVQVFVNRCMCFILGITWPLVIYNEDQWEIPTRKRWLTKYAEESRGEFSIFVQETSGLTRQVLFWNLQGGGKQGYTKPTYYMCYYLETIRGPRTTSI